MARFRLKAKHYLAVPGSTWEQTETDQQTGVRARKVHEVPRYLDPDAPPDCNYPGEIIVTTKTDTKFPRDILFRGPPTPDMEPLDDEAIVIMDNYMAQFGGQHPIESLEATGVIYSDRVLENLQKQVASLVSKSEQTDRMFALEKQVAELTKQLETAKNVRRP
jgi:hypothetical protein